MQFIVFFRPKMIFIVTEKHKNYHMKDEQLNKDGFKKFMKHEPCGFLSCKFSRTHNHIHCIRSNCDYVLHSSGQLFSHKRKHERKDNELAYRKYKLAQSMIPGQNGGGLAASFPGFPAPPTSPDTSLQGNIQQHFGQISKDSYVKFSCSVRTLRSRRRTPSPPC